MELLCGSGKCAGLNLKEGLPYLLTRVLPSLLTRVLLSLSTRVLPSLLSEGGVITFSLN